MFHICVFFLSSELLTMAFELKFDVDLLELEEEVIAARPVAPRHLDHVAVEQRHVDLVVEAKQTSSTNKQHHSNNKRKTYDVNE